MMFRLESNTIQDLENNQRLLGIAADELEKVREALEETGNNDTLTSFCDALDYAINTEFNDISYIIQLRNKVNEK